jgi:hypothetical protein
MRLSTTTLALATLAPTATAFTLFGKSLKAAATKPKAASVATELNPLFDPLGLYPKNAPERKKGLLQPLEGPILKDSTIKDPLNLYADKSQVSETTEMSASLPFLKRPEMLKDLPGDRGFDPFNFAQNENALQWQRTAEIKHARLAMLAAVGWPIAELLDKKLAAAYDLIPLLGIHDRVPSVLNGGLDKVNPAFWAATLGVAAAIESLGLLKEANAKAAGGKYTPGDLGFDPFELSAITKDGRKYQLEAELFNGRLAMLAITWYALQEFVTNNAVVNETPFLFNPL